MDAEQLFENNQHLVDITLKRYLKDPHYVARKNGMEYDDLKQYGLIGLWRAAEKYDGTKGMKFQNFAIKNIKWELNWRMRNDSQWISGFTKEAEEYRRSNRPVSMESKPTILDESLSYHDLIGSTYNLEHDAIGRMMSEHIENNINPRTLEFLKLKMRGETLNEIGKRYGITHQAVGISIKKCANKLRKLKGVI